MKSPPSQATQAQAEAAEWLARLGNHSISTETVRAFREWRDDPANDAAYQEAEAFWEASGRQAADPQILRMTEQALARGRRRRRWLAGAAQVRWALAAAGVLILLAAGAQVVAWRFPTYATGAGEQRIVRLADGSRVHLNVESRVKVRFFGGTRRLVLDRGEAFFEVAHDATRPFVVQADGARVRALGTKFDVRDQGDRVQVTLLEGRVQVRRDGPQAWTLVPNQTLVVSDRGVTRPAATDAARTTSWTTGRLAFRETPLAEAVAEVNRYGKSRIVLEGEALPSRLVNGYFDVGDTDAFVRGVSVLFDLQATHAGDGVITLRERPATSG
jgi:transmembrane sensor